MAGRNTKLTPDLIDLIVKSIENGSFDHVAATAAGIGRQTFYDWMRRGQEGHDNELYVEFYERVTQARASARTVAENKVFQEDPFRWLRYGPGRHRPEEPGWTNETTLTVTPGNGKIKLTWADDNLLEDSESEEDVIDA